MIKTRMFQARGLVFLSLLAACSFVPGASAAGAGGKLDTLRADSREASTPAEHDAVRDRLMRYSEQMEQAAGRYEALASEAPVVHEAIVQKKGMTIDPAFRHELRARKAAQRAHEARVLAAYHQQQARASADAGI